MENNKILTMIKTYQKAYDILNAKFDEIRKKRDETVELKKKKADSEDLMFRTAEIKNFAVDFHKMTLDLGVDIKVDNDFYETEIRLGKADEMLKNLGYLKITETIRSSAVESLPETREFRRLLGKTKSLAIGYQNILYSLQMDEVDFRQGAKLKMQVHGAF